jgi:ubiquitin carboxyl-terminal hydrolase L5
MNVPKIDLGEKLGTFKAETKGLKPAYRGQELGDNKFIRNIHNSFASVADWGSRQANGHAQRRSISLQRR